MEPTELSIKVAEITLQTKWAEILSDLLKIGIPSFITLCSLLSAYFIARKSHEKDITITKMKIDSDSKKEIMTREVELIKNISLGLSEVHNSATQYISLFAAKLDLLADGLLFPVVSQTKLSDTYEQCVKSMHENIVIESNILLLGDDQIIAAFREYHSLLTAIGKDYAPHDIQVKYNDLMNEGHKLNTKKETLFRLLNRRYLSGYASWSDQK